MRLLALMLCLASASFAEDLIFLRVNPGGAEEEYLAKFEEARGR